MNRSVKRESYFSAYDRANERDATHPYKITCPTLSSNALRFEHKTEADEAFQKIKEQGIHQAIYSYSFRIDNFSNYKIIGYTGGLNAKNN